MHCTGGARLSEYDRPPLLDLVSYLPEDILTKVDRASMAVSLEVRAPLLDHRVAEFALTLPRHSEAARRDDEYLLRRLLYKRVPRELLERPKMGFGVPLGDWFDGPLGQRMTEFVAGPHLEDLGIDPSPTRRIWAEFLNRRTRRTELLWQMFALISWARAARTTASQCAIPA